MQSIVEVTLKPAENTLRLEWGMPIDTKKRGWVWNHKPLEIRLYCHPYPDFGKPILLNTNLDERDTTHVFNLTLPFLDTVGLGRETTESGFQPGLPAADTVGKFYPVRLFFSPKDIPAGGNICYPAIEWSVGNVDWLKQSLTAWVVFGYTERGAFIPVYETPPLEHIPPEGAILPLLPEDVPNIAENDRVRRRGATPKVFISYSRADKFAVNTIALRLGEEFYYDVWIDYDGIAGGADWKEAIAQGIQAAEVVLFMATPTACASKWCKAEIDRAKELGKVIIPIKLSGALTTADLANIGLEQLNWIDFSGGGDWDRLVKTLPLVTERDLRLLDPDFKKLHRDYLRSLIHRYSKVNLTYLLDAAPKERIGLFEVYVPLKLGIDFTVLSEHEEFKDWGLRILGHSLNSVQEIELPTSITKSIRGFTPHGEALDAWVEHLKQGWERFKARHEEREVQKLEAQREKLKDKIYNWGRIESEIAPALMPHLVITGGPGSGKSTLMQHLALCMAGDMLAQDDDDKGTADLDRLAFWPLPAYTPIFIEMRAMFRTSFSSLDDTVTLEKFFDYLHAAILKPSGVSAYLEPLKDQMRDGDVMFFLDGLDEVPDASEDKRRDQIKTLITLLRDTFPKCRILVTSRPHTYNGNWSLGDDFGLVELIDLDSDRLEELALRLFRVVLGQEGAEEQTPQFKKQIKKVPKRLRGSPLFFTLMAAIWLNNQKKSVDQRLPTVSAGAIYRECVDMLIRRWTRKDIQTGRSVADEIGLNKEQLRLLLEMLAYQVHSERGNQDDAVFRSSKIVDAIEDLGLRNVNYDILLETLAQRAGVIYERDPRRFQFAHRSFQEHLAACYLARTNYPTLFVEVVRKNPALWGNVMDLFPDQVKTEDLWEVVAALTPEEDELLPDGTDNQFWIGCIYAARLMTTFLPEKGRQQKLYLPAIQRALKHFLEIDVIPPVDRAEAGRYFAKLGDTRPKIIQTIKSLDDIDWVTIPEDGEWVYQGAKHAPLAAFRISRYPITYAQFQSFVDAQDRDDKRWWEGMPLHQEVAGTIFKVREFREQQFKHANHPRENVSWYQALAFCRWLSDKLGVEITLPTEEQWEKAARGTDERKYPYLGKFDVTKANTREAGIGQTSAVGIFLQGASPYGVLDMSGNVWEWCLNKYDDPAVTVVDGSTDGRSLRGGSWDDGKGSARVSDRYWYVPFGRYDHFGFRVVLLSPIFSNFKSPEIKA